MNTIAIVILVIIVGALLLNNSMRKQLIVKFRGRTEEIARNDASTVSGAKDYFNAAIREKEELYSKASRSFAEISGKLDEAEKKKYDLKKQLMKIDSEIRSALDDNRESDAKRLALKKVTITEQIKSLSEAIDELKTAKTQQQEIRDAAKSALDDLREEKERTIFRMETDEQIISLHESLNGESYSNETSVMLERVREGAKKTRERAAGSQISYETSSAALDRKYAAEERDREVERILEQMKEK